VDASGEALIDNDNGTFTDKDGNLVYDGETYNPVESDIPGIYKDKDGEIVYTGADGIPGTEDDGTYVIPTTPTPRQNIRVAFVSPVSPFPSGGTVTDAIVLEFAPSTPYSGNVKYVSSDPSIISVSSDGKLTATVEDIDATATITAIFDDGSIASKSYRIVTAAQLANATYKLDHMGSSTSNASMNEVIGIGASGQSATGGAAYNTQSISYRLVNAGGTGSVLSAQGHWLTVGSTPGTVEIEATATNTDGEACSPGTILINVLGTPTAETVYETTSTNWATLEAAPEYAGGSGTEADPYLISSVRQLKKINVDNDLYGAVDATYGKFFELTTDLDFAGEEEDGITSNLIGSFYGTFDGKGHLIKHLTIHSTSGGATIFGSISYGELKNLGRVGGESVTTAQGAGGLVGTLSTSKLTNCFNTAPVTGASNAGGLTGGAGSVSIATIDTPSIIENCYNKGDVKAESASSAGGITGASASSGGYVIIKNSYNSGNIQAVNYAGGLIGIISREQGNRQTYNLSNSFNFGEVVKTSSNNRYVGSICGGTSAAEPDAALITIIANNVISRPDVAKYNTTTAANFVIGISAATQTAQDWVQSILSANPTLKEDAKYTLDYSHSAAFVTELGEAFKYASGRTPKLAWEK
jgi:hypothetical protein